MREFRDIVAQFLNAELFPESDFYPKLREEVAKRLRRATEITVGVGTPFGVTSYPAPAIGGPVMHVDLYQAVLADFRYRRIDKQMSLDAIDQAIGACELRVRSEYRNLFNPFHWIFLSFKSIIRLPFIIIQTSGFDVSKVEDHFLGKFFKLAEAAFIFFVLYRVFYLPLGQLRDIVVKWFVPK